MAEIIKLRGGAAFSSSRIGRIAEQARQWVPGLRQLCAEHWYFVELTSKLAPDELARLGQLLGVSATLPVPPGGTLLLVTPRLGTISPWSTKATEIAGQCGFAGVARIERLCRADHQQGGEDTGHVQRV